QVLGWALALLCRRRRGDATDPGGERPSTEKTQAWRRLASGRPGRGRTDAGPAGCGLDRAGRGAGQAGGEARGKGAACEAALLRGPDDRGGGAGDGDRQYDG